MLSARLKVPCQALRDTVMQDATVSSLRALELLAAVLEIDNISLLIARVCGCNLETGDEIVKTCVFAFAASCCELASHMPTVAYTGLLRPCCCSGDERSQSAHYHCCCYCVYLSEQAVDTYSVT